MTKDFLKFMGEDSGNVAMDGNFSVQVIERNSSYSLFIFRSTQDLKTNNALNLSLRQNRRLDNQNRFHL